MTKKIAVIDASVIYQAQSRDLLLQMAYDRLFSAKWTEEIHEEWISNLLKNRKDISRDLLELTKKNMNTRILNCLVENYEHRVENLILPDPDDRHVLAAAIECQANFIITFNLKDFPKDVLMEFNVRAIHPDIFLKELSILGLESICFSVGKILARLKNPPLSLEEYIIKLEALNFLETSSILRKNLLTITLG